MIASKPSTAQLIAQQLSGGFISTLPNNVRPQQGQVFEFEGTFPGSTPSVGSKIAGASALPDESEDVVDADAHPHKFLITDTTRLFEHQFKRERGDKLTPFELLSQDVEVQPTEYVQMNQTIEHLVSLSKGCGKLVLWLDSDGEGETICFEAIELLRRSFKNDAHVGGGLHCEACFNVWSVFCRKLFCEDIGRGSGRTCSLSSGW